jgi:hypothetical protein
MHYSHVGHTYCKRRKHGIKELVHLSNKLVDIVFPISKMTTLNKVLKLACPPATHRVGEFEGPQEVRRLLEIGTSCDNLMYEILHREDIIFAKSLFDHSIVYCLLTLPYPCL